MKYWLAQLVTRDDLPIPKVDLTRVRIANALQLVFGLAGGIALLVIARSAFRYVISQGEPQKIAKEKDAIIYAIVGLVICIIAFSAVSFVIREIER